MQTKLRGTKVRTIAAAAMTLGLFGCGGEKYASDGGDYVVELNSGGKSKLAMGGMSLDCTYTTSGDQVTMNCPENEPMVFTKKDNTLISPPGSPAGTLKRK
jgi:hypothetical protein